VADFANLISTRDPKLVSRYKSVDNAYTTTGTKTITIDCEGKIRSGFLRIRTKSVNGSSLCQFKAKADDDSTTQVILPQTNTTAAGEAVDFVIPLHSDLDIQDVTVEMLVTADGNITLDAEVAGSR
jgi:hypothetical protein